TRFSRDWSSDVCSSDLLKRGAHVVVGTPGRVMDHLRRGSLNLNNLKALVLDEADEMLRMGFIDDVEWILEHTPKTRQTALFSATMPREIRRVAHSYLNNAKEISIQRSEEHTSELQSRENLVCRLLLEKKQDSLDPPLPFRH